MTQEKKCTCYLKNTVYFDFPSTSHLSGCFLHVPPLCSKCHLFKVHSCECEDFVKPAPPAQEKKCICPPYKIGHVERCPLYTPPAQEEKKSTKRERHVTNQDFYWEVVDHDDDYDGNLHVVSVVDGSEIKISIADILKSLGISHPPQPKEPETWEELQKQEVTFEVLAWSGGKCLLLNDLRIAGGKAYGGGTVEKKWKTDVKSVLEGLGILMPMITAARTEAETKNWNAAIEACLAKWPTPLTYFDKGVTDSNFEEYSSRCEGRSQFSNEARSLLESLKKV